MTKKVKVVVVYDENERVDWKVVLKMVVAHGYGCGCGCGCCYGYERSKGGTLEQGWRLGLSGET